MRKTKLFALASLVLVAAALSGGPTRAQDSLLDQLPRQAVCAFADGLNRADGQAVQAVVTPQLWARLQPSFQGATPGTLGTYKFLDGTLLAPGASHAMVTVLCTHADGVEDIVTVTVRKDGAAWKVCGGPGGATTTPLR